MRTARRARRPVPHREAARRVGRRRTATRRRRARTDRPRGRRRLPLAGARPGRRDPRSSGGASAAARHRALAGLDAAAGMVGAHRRRRRAGHRAGDPPAGPRTAPGRRGRSRGRDVHPRPGRLAPGRRSGRCYGRGAPVRQRGGRLVRDDAPDRHRGDRDPVRLRRPPHDARTAPDRRASGDPGGSRASRPAASRSSGRLGAIRTRSRRRPSSTRSRRATRHGCSRATRTRCGRTGSPGRSSPPRARRARREPGDLRRRAGQPRDVDDDRAPDVRVLLDHDRLEARGTARGTVSTWNASPTWKETGVPSGSRYRSSASTVPSPAPMASVSRIDWSIAIGALSARWWT